MVDPVAPGVTKRTLVSFPGFMRFLRLLVLLPVWLLVIAADTPTTSPSPSPAGATPATTPTPTPSPSPSPSPIPVNAFLSLDVTAGNATTVINVSGGQFLPNETLTLYWDQPTKVAGSATADSNGSFNTRVKPFAGDPPGVHKLCASVQPNPCANFTLQAASASPSPSPTPSESPSPSASPEETPAFVATPARISTSLSGFDVISRPPFVFLPIFGAGALLLSLAYWAFSAIRRPRRPSLLPSAAVVHRATRPDYSAGFGTPPSGPSQGPAPSAWNEPMRSAPPAAPARPLVMPVTPLTPVPPVTPVTPVTPPPPAVPQEPQVEWGPPVEWGTGKAGWGFEEPPEVDDSAEIPQPGD